MTSGNHLACQAASLLGSALLHLFLTLSVAAQSESTGASQDPTNRELSQRDQIEPLRRQADLVDQLQRLSWLYFVEQVNPDNGLVKDRSTEASPASIAGTGFAIPVWAIGVEHAWLTRARALQLTGNLLQFLHDAPQGREPDASGYRGLFYHFLDMQTGRRVWNCELSTIDTALLLAGVRFARSYYDRENPQEAKVRQLADALTQRVEWDWLTIREQTRYAGSLSHGWRPESGAIPYGWVGYNEALVLYILAAGTGYQDAVAAYQRWLSFYEWQEPWPEQQLLAFAPLFGHQYSHMFVDFRGLPDAYMRSKGIDYFENSRRAVVLQRRYAIENPGGFVGYGKDIWGLTACDGPGASRNAAGKTFHGYTARGANGPGLGQNDDGTIAPTAAASSIAFAPELVVPAIAAMHDRYGEAGLWGPYGFKDAFNPTADWIASDYLAIDQAPIVLMIENWRNGFVWRHMMDDAAVGRGLKLLGFAEPKPNPIEQQVAAFERTALRAKPSRDSVLFLGGSSIANWQGLQDDIAPVPVIQAGFGGATATDLIHYYHRVVAPIRPRTIVLATGDDDMATGSTTIDVLVRMRELIRWVQRDLPDTKVFVLAMPPSIARRHLWPQMQIANALAQDHCERTAGCEFVDITKAMLTKQGAIRDDVFVADNLHLNRRGYAGWSQLVRAALQTDNK